MTQVLPGTCLLFLFFFSSVRLSTRLAKKLFKLKTVLPWVNRSQFNIELFDQNHERDDSSRWARHVQGFRYHASKLGRHCFGTMYSTGYASNHMHEDAICEAHKLAEAVTALKLESKTVG